MFGRSGAAAVGLLVALSALPSTARAIVIPSFSISNGPAIPANGVVLFRDPVIDVAISSGDIPISGTASLENGWGIWRPDAAWSLGEYWVSPTLANDVFGEAAGEALTVVEAATPPSDFVSLGITTEVKTMHEVAWACCEVDEALLAIPEPCDPTFGNCPKPAPEPYCAPIRYAETQIVTLGVSWDDTLPIASQVLARVAEFEAQAPTEYLNNPFSTSFQDDDPTEDEYCATAEIWDLTDGSVEEQQTCVPNPKPVLGEVDVEPAYFGTFIKTCMLPPEGLTEPWCEAMSFDCSTRLATLNGPEYDYLVAMCVHHFELCGTSPPPPYVDPGTSSGGSGATPGTAGTGAGGTAPEPGVAPRGQSSRKSSCGVGASGRGGHASSLAMGLLLLVAARRRRLQAREPI